MVAVHIQTPLAFSVGLLGNILSFLVTVAPMPTFYKVYKKKSTGSFQSTPYVIALSSALLWLYYAVLTKNILLLTINLITCVLESSYLVVYLFYSTRRDKVSTAKMMSIFDAGLIAFVLLLTLVFLNEEKRTEITGWICASFTVCVFIAPLSIIRFIIITKSVEFMPFWLSFFLTLSAVAWFFYGLLLKDLFVALPNVLGFLFGLAQITLYAIYRNANNADQEQGSSGRVAEAGDAGDSKIDIEMAEEVVIKESDAAEIVVTVEIKREA